MSGTIPHNTTQNSGGFISLLVHQAAFDKIGLSGCVRRSQPFGESIEGLLATGRDLPGSYQCFRKFPRGCCMPLQETSIQDTVSQREPLLNVASCTG